MSRSFSKYFDHTLLRPDATTDEIRTLVSEALEHDFASVCVNGCHVDLAAKLLAGDPGDHAGRSTSDVKVACVIGFPLGANSTGSKLEETRLAIADGAHEIDMVINIGAAKDGRWDLIEDEIRALADICHGEKPVLLKVIIEVCLLTDEEIKTACLTAKKAGADFVKTSTGFSSGGATVSAVRLMKKTVGDSLKVKASGGIRTLEDAKAMIDAGADRLGCSASVSIMEEYSLLTEQL